MTGVVLEAKKHRLSQNQDGGWRLSINIHPNDELPSWLLTAPLGQRLGIVISALKEQPQGKLNSGSAPPPHADAADSPAAALGPGSSSGRTAEFGSANGGSSPSPGTKPKKHWDDYSPSQQAGMACNSGAFQEWMRARGGYGALPDGTSPSDLVRLWLYDELAINSRSDLDTNPEAAKRWRDLYGMFQADTQYGERR